jgi:hypothetical protein
MQDNRKLPIARHLMRIAFALALLPCAGQAQEVVGGVSPATRPANAPKITQVEHGQDWYRSALTGVSAPYPRSLSFLDNQGNWYTPFSRRGMPGRYDIRQLHGAR